MLRRLPALTLVLMLGPVLAGLLGTLAPAFGFLPALGGEALSLDPWRALMTAPGLWGSIRLSLSTGFLSTLLALAVVVAFCAAWQGTRPFRWFQRLLSPLLSVPHVTVAFGLAFLLAPSGWLLRLFSPWATGLERPPDYLFPQDGFGLALVLGLLLKEAPFLFLMVLAAMGQVDAERAHRVARSLGYRPMTAWMKAVFPRIYPQIRLPVLAVLAYSLSVVDMALVLGPTRPPTLAVQLLTWFSDADLALRFQAAAGAVLQLLLVIFAIGLWLVLERLAVTLGRRWIAGGGRGAERGLGEGWLRFLGAAPTVLLTTAVFLGLASLLVWSLAGPWRFPDALPSSWTLKVWSGQGAMLLQPSLTTALLALGAAAIAALLCLGCLEQEVRGGKRLTTRALWLLYLPLLAPQIGFLFGLQVLFVWLGLDGVWPGLLWSHLVFVLPYVFLSLRDPYRAWDPRYGRSALCLGASPWRVFWRIKFPMLLRPLLIASAVGFAVSVAQYLPTLFAGAGRFQTLTTEAVALSAGGNRRLIGAFGVLQMLLPLAGFALALALPAWLYRNRRGMATEH
ncbi:MAG: ABC transporter permease subunit [Limibacillus sp.]